MNVSQAPQKWLVIDAVCYLMIASVAGRMLPYYLQSPYRWVVIALLGVYTMLFSVARFSRLRLQVIMHLYFVVQVLITLTLNQVLPSYDGPQDYFIMLVLPLCVQAVWQMPPRVATAWVAAFSAIMAFAMVVYYQRYEGSWEGIGYGLAYVAGCIMVSAFSSLVMRADRARVETQRLNEDLRQANEKLQAYTRQVEQLASAEERARLARDLHDSVSQTIFSVTLTAQAARILLDRDPARVPEQLDHLQVLARSALAEMRSLIQHMRSTERDGLPAMLRRSVQERAAQDGLQVELFIQGDRLLSFDLEQCLFRVAQEALNNVVKHSGTTCARLYLDLDCEPVTLVVEDDGCGFDLPTAQTSPGHFGLASMAERIHALGGRLDITSRPGLGTTIRVTAPAEKEGEHV